ncbi:MAG TPA: DEAD/DEAH box helicase family protein, partial [Gammaproteobacteria bacterium]
MQQRHPILQIAIPSPLYRTFDYLPPQDCDHEFISGMRLRIPFGRTTKIGILLATGQKSRIDTPRLKHALEVIDRESLLPPDILDLMAWACRYYHHPPGDVIFSALPTLLRQGHAARLHETKSWRLTEDGARIDPVQLARAPRQAALLELLRTHPQGLDAGKLLHQLPHWRTAMRPLIEKGWAELDEKTVLPAPMTAGKQGPGGNELTPDQGHIVQTVCSALDEFKTFLLEGVTGSGKTEVYMHIIDQVIQANKQALVLVPEIGLTPQLISQFCDYFQVPVSVLHS